MRKFLILFILVIAFSGYGWLGERCLCEQWVSEERVDTISNAQFSYPILHNVTNTHNATQFWWNFDVENDWMEVSFPIENCDSLTLDSLNICGKGNDLTVADTFYIEIRKASCSPTTRIIERDTIWITLDNYAAGCLMYNKSLEFDLSMIESASIQLKYAVRDIDGNWRMFGMVIYYTAYWKRYGIPQ